MQHCALLEGRTQGTVETVFEEQFPVPADHVRKEVAVERGVGVKKRYEV